jgi:hypothetical protein
MALSNFERMIQLADEVFSSRTDDSQLAIDEEVMQRLQNIILQPSMNTTTVMVL